MSSLRRGHGDFVGDSQFGTDRAQAARRHGCRYLVGVPAALAAANAAALLVKLPGILSVLYLNSDTASAPVIATLMRAAPKDRVVTLGNYPWYEALWFMEATIGLPGHRTIWEIAPVIWTALTFGLMIWMAFVVLGRWGALVTTALLACIAPFEQSVLLTLDTHGPLLVHAVVLLSVLVFLESHPRQVNWRIMTLIGLPLVAFTAMGVASDSLSLFAALVPFVVAALVSAVGSRAHQQVRIACFSVGVAAASMLTGEGLASVMRADHVSGVPLVVHLVRSDEVGSNLEIFVKSFTNLGGGDFLDVGGRTFVTWLAGLLVLFGLACVVLWLSARVPHIFSNPAPRRMTDGARTYVAFWASCLVAVSAVFLFSSVPQDSHSARDLANAYVAVIALVALPGARSRRVRFATLVGVALFSAVSLYGTVRQPSVATVADAPIAQPVAAEIQRFVLANGARSGYADYWDAAALTWQTGFAVPTYPAWDCQLPAGTLCSFPLNKISSWYERSDPGQRFLIIDPAQPDPLSADPAAGAPVARATFGGVEVLVYDHDLAVDVHGS